MHTSSALSFASISASLALGAAIPDTTDTESVSPPFNCPLHFRNVVFNHHFDSQSGYPQPRWDTLASHGVSNWVGFLNYSLTPIPDNETPLIVHKNLPRIVYQPFQVDGAIKLLKSQEAPAYLEMFNEPDYPRPKRNKPYVGPIKAAKALKPLLDGDWPKTKLVSPALAHSDSEAGYKWWHTFNSEDGCNHCLNSTKIPVVAGHFYDHDPHRWLERVATFVSWFPGKEIWITEMAPATRSDQACTLSPKEMKHWMTVVVKGLVTQKRFNRVKRMYWNAGEWSPFHKGDDLGVCNHSLTHEDGSATDLLRHYASLCK